MANPTFLYRDPTVRKLRKCLTCPRIFASQHFGHRICYTCKTFRTPRAESRGVFVREMPVKVMVD